MRKTVNVQPVRKLIVVLAGSFIVLAALAAYHNSFTGPFTLDDWSSITENQSIRHLWPIWDVLSPPASAGVGGRPVFNFSFAINYALGRTAVRGYHALNLAIHILAGLTLFGVVRRTLLQPVMRERFGAAAMPLALATAVLWTVHPLQTEAVTYVSQRAESLMGLLYLLTMYCFIRGTEPQARGFWFTLSMVACVLGMATKEVMVTAPLMVLLYDRTFVAGSFREAWARRSSVYVGLASTWLMLGLLMVGLHSRGVGYDLGVTWWAYALTECRVIVQYLWLSIWPHPLLFDYGTGIIIRRATEAAPYTLVVLLLVAGVVVALKRRVPIGFVGAWFFAILAPASSVVPVAGQPMAESRMYLSLAAVIALVVMGIYKLMGRWSVAVFLALAIGLGLLTLRRNEDYRSELVMWGDTVTKRPDNSRAHNNLGVALAAASRLPEAIAHYEEALRIKPDYAEAHNNLGVALADAGRVSEAIEHENEALRLKPNYAHAHNNLGYVLYRAGRLPEAMGQYEEALRLKPDYAGAHNNLGLALADLGRLPEAMEQYQEALRLVPDYAGTHNNLGIILADVGRLPEALRHYKEALRIEPDYAEAHNNFGLALTDAGRLPEAMEQYEEALRLKPDYAEAYNSLGLALAHAGRLPEAMECYGEALRYKPDYAYAHNNLALVLADTGRLSEAIEHQKEALRYKPDYPKAHFNLGNVLFEMGRSSEAMEHYEEALRLQPDYAEAHNNLGLALANAGRLPEAMRHYEEALRSKSDYAEAHFNLGNALLEMDRSSEAIAHYRAVLRLRPDNAYAHNNLGVVLANSFQVPEAIAHYEQALRLKPDYAQACSNLVALQSAQQTANPTR